MKIKIITPIYLGQTKEKAQKRVVLPACAPLFYLCFKKATKNAIKCFFALKQILDCGQAVGGSLHLSTLLCCLHSDSVYS